MRITQAAVLVATLAAFPLAAQGNAPVSPALGRAFVADEVVRTASESDPAVPGFQERYRVFLLTMDQGDLVWERFGHNAILIEDGATGDRLVWNWGLFDFQAEDFILRFARGTMPFSMGPAELDPFVASYAAANRSVYANEVMLTQEEARTLDEFVRWNFRPENREYVYDYFLDNCSTRVRDALDSVLGGLLREELESIETPRSYRWHVRRAGRGIWWLDQGLNLLMGSYTDRHVTAWEASFLPVEFLEHATSIERAGPGGQITPLFGPSVVLFEASRDPVPSEPSGFSLLWVIGGAILACLVLALGRAARVGRRWARVATGSAVLVWGVVVGALSVPLTLIWFTAHEFGHWNVNLLHLSPVAWGLVGATAWALAQGFAPGTRAVRIASLFAVTLAALSLLAALAQLLGLVGQDNLEVLVVALPVNLSVALALGSLARRPSRDSNPGPGAPATA